MKKILLVGLISASTVFAANLEPFVGLDFSRATVDTKYNETVTRGTSTNGTTTYSAGDTYNLDYSEGDVSYLLKAGLIIDNKHRVYLKYGTFDYSLDTELEITTLNYDYLIEYGNKYNITPFVGFHIGQGTADLSDFISDSGNVYGLQTGAIIPIKEKVDFEFGISYTNSDIQKKESVTVDDGRYTDGYTYTNFGSDITGEIKNIVAINFGINYKF